MTACFPTLQKITHNVNYTLSIKQHKFTIADDHVTQHEQTTGTLLTSTKE